jgi:hypothetical protein
MDDTDNFDLSAMSFSAFVEFFFNHPEDQEFWSGDPQYSYRIVPMTQPEVFVDHLTRLFAHFPSVVRKYSLRQINSGIWALVGPALPVIENLWERSVPLEKRIACIRAMHSVYANFVATSKVEVMENCFDMWWDMLSDSFWMQTGQIESPDASKLDSDSRTILDAMFDTLKQILELPDLRTQGYALHGLGHLHHPGVRALVQQYINVHKREFAPDQLKWVESCRDGTVM